MMNTSLTLGYCGTYATGWYTGRYLSIFYETASFTACFGDSTDICQRCRPIKIINLNSKNFI